MNNQAWKTSHEAACQQATQAGLSTGHAQTPEELMNEVLFQLEEVRAQRDAARTEHEKAVARVHELQSYIHRQTGENDTLRAEVKRRGEMLRRALNPLRHTAIRRLPDLEVIKLIQKIEALTDED